MTRVFQLLAIAALFAGCATSSHVIVGTVRPAISPDAVNLYLRPPPKYEEIALLEASSKQSFSPGDQAKTNKVIERLKAEAASLGANGVLLQGVADQYGGSVTTGFGSATASGNTAFGTGFGVSTPIHQKAGNGIAIYVPVDSSSP
jgi:hypothetical protein